MDRISDCERTPHLLFCVKRPYMVKENMLPYEMLLQWSTEQLDERLARELQKEFPEEETVRMILAILKDREKGHPVEITPEVEQAWSKYQDASKVIAESRTNPRRIPSWLVRAASIVLVLLLLAAALPQNAQADNIWERFARWTSEVFEFFSPHAKEAVQKPYEFKTEHPGLQQIYDTVVEMGITEPVVPMRLPEEYELIEQEVHEIMGCEFLLVTLSDGTNEVIIEIKKFDALIPGQYEKDDTEVKVLEIQGNVHYVMHNRGRWNVVWTKNSLECCLSIDCQEDMLYDVLKSIYGMEEYV